MLFQSTGLAVLLLQLTFSVSAGMPETERRLSFERIAGYQPTTQVTDHAAIDLDMAIMNQQLSEGNLIKARNVYEQGGHSYSFAEIRLVPNQPDYGASWPVGTQVFGFSEDGNEVTGTLLEAIEWTPVPGQPYQVNCEVLYKTTDIQEFSVGCQVGGLYTFGAAKRDGCFVEQGTNENNQALRFLLPGVFDASQATAYPYFYDSRQSNYNGRFLKRFSEEAAETMTPCPQCGYYPDFTKFFQYYGNFDYADKWIEAAFFSQQTNFQNGRGNANFAEFSTKGALAEAISKGASYMSVLMYVIRELEDAITDCSAECAIGSCNDAPVHALDEAVAFYVGSLEGKDGSGDGVLLYNLADKRSVDFRTAGEDGDALVGTSYINIQIMREFQRAQLFLLEGDCSSTEVNKQNIVNYMKVPLVQGALRYAFVRNYESPSTVELVEKAEAEGASFAASILPWVHACSEVDADIIYDNLRVGSRPENVDFVAVKKAFERNYKCMGITCGEVGGLWSVDGYLPNAKPCGTGFSASGSGISSGDDDKKAGVIIGSLIGVSFGLALLAFAWWSSCKSKGSTSKGSGNIAAVSEIS